MAQLLIRVNILSMPVQNMKNQQQADRIIVYFMVFSFALCRSVAFVNDEKIED